MRVNLRGERKIDLSLPRRGTACRTLRLTRMGAWRTRLKSFQRFAPLAHPPHAGIACRWRCRSRSCPKPPQNFAPEQNFNLGEGVVFNVQSDRQTDREAISVPRFN